MTDLASGLRLVFVTPADRAPEATTRLVDAVVEGGVTAVLLRERQLDDAQAEDLYGRLAPRLREAGVLALVSRDPALAVRAGAHGVHLGHGAPTVAEARRAAPGLLVGRSAHWPLVAEDEAADYATFSPFWPTPASHPRPDVTPDQVEEACRRLGPVVALGGLDAARVAELPPGPVGVAILGALARAEDPRGTAAQLRSLVDARLAFGGLP